MQDELRLLRTQEFLEAKRDALGTGTPGVTGFLAITF